MPRKITNLAHAREARQILRHPQAPAAELARNAAKMRRMRAYHTLVLSVALGTAALYIAGAVYLLVML